MRRCLRTDPPLLDLTKIQTSATVGTSERFFVEKAQQKLAKVLPDVGLSKANVTMAYFSPLAYT